MWNKIVVEEGNRALAYRDGVCVRFLGPGAHKFPLFAGPSRVKNFDLTELVINIDLRPQLARLIPEDEVEQVLIPADCAGLLRRRGVPMKVLPAGLYLRWKAMQTELEIIDLRPLHSQIPREFVALADKSMVYEAAVSEDEQVLLFVDGALEGPLGPGQHLLSPWRRKLRLTRFSARDQEIKISGQELMSADKVSMRINLLVRYRIRDAACLVRKLASAHDACYSEAQIAARYALAGATVDRILEDRASIAQQMQAQVADRLNNWGLELISLDIKDLILPGEMKAMFHQVIEAEKRAQAQLILRREEVAATRSLANTARMLEQNPVLLKLKQLEGYKELAERIPKLTLLMDAGAGAKGLRFLEES